MKAKEYAELKVKQYDKNHTIEGYGMHRAMQQCNFDGFDIQEDFEEGWSEALKSQWIKVEEKTPNEHEEVLVLFEHEGEIRIETDVYFGDNFYNYYRNYVWDFGGEKIIAWMPIPSFDEILEANKDVSKRLK